MEVIPQKTLFTWKIRFRLKPISVLRPSLRKQEENQNSLSAKMNYDRHTANALLLDNFKRTWNPLFPAERNRSFQDPDSVTWFFVQRKIL